MPRSTVGSRGSAGSPAPLQQWELRPGVQGYSWPADTPRAALLLQHGYGEYAARYVHQYHQLIPRLLDIGVTVHAFDMEGHGRSEGRRGEPDVEQAVRDHLAARQMFQSGPLPLFLMGHSLGALVTASSVALEPSGASGAIISSAALPDANVFLRLLARLLAAVAPHAPAPTVSLEGLSRIPEVMDAVEHDPMMYHGRLPNVVAAAALARARANRELYARWTVPTLILHGTDDRVTDPAGSRSLHQAIGAADNTLHLVEGGYHELLNDIGREETMSVVLGWLEGRLPRASGR